MPLFIGNTPLVEVKLGESSMFAVQVANVDDVDETVTIPLFPADRLITESGEFLVTELGDNLITAQDVQISPPVSRFITASDEFLVTQLNDNLVPIQEF